MPCPPAILATIDEFVNRLAAESVLASVGRDDGLIPAYSLLGEIRQLCEDEPVIRAPVVEVHTAIDRLLDSGKPFDEARLSALLRLVEWLPGATEALRAGRAPRPIGASGHDGGEADEGPAFDSGLRAGADAGAAGGGASEVEEDVLLELDVAANGELLAEFYAEVVDHLQQIEAALLAIEQEPHDQEALSSVFRSFHTIKGNAGFLGLKPMHRLAHEVESLLDRARNHEIVLNSASITEILRSRDALQALTQQVAVTMEKGRMPSEIVPVRHLIQSIRSLAKRSAGGAGDAGSERAAAETPPPAGGDSRSPIDTGTASPLHGREEEAQGTPAPFAGVAEVKSRQAGERAGDGRAGGQTVRVSTEKLDSLMDVVGELVIVQSQLLESARQAEGKGVPVLHRNVAQLGRITKELQHTAMSLRLIPIKPTFQKMERLARDLARVCEKKVVFTTDGDDTELDRTMVEEIADPLVHMVRNAIDHGLEPAADRLALGKPDVGLLHLCAHHQGSNIVIELRDDGRGIDPARILAKARAQGLVAEGTEPPVDEIYKLIFLPGFSTAQKVTAVSGRGVGMDVVKRNIDKLRGKIEIVSEIGRGSSFKIKLPLTMAIIDGLVLRVGEDRFILPSTSVQMALRPTREQICHVQGGGELIDLRGRLLPLHRLDRKLGIASYAREPWEGIVLIVENSGKACALMVDDMVSKQEVVIKNLGGYLRNLPGVSGGAILGDGTIALILDPGTILQAA